MSPLAESIVQEVCTYCTYCRTPPHAKTVYVNIQENLMKKQRQLETYTIGAKKSASNSQMSDCSSVICWYSSSFDTLHHLNFERNITAHAESNKNCPRMWSIRTSDTLVGKFIETPEIIFLLRVALAANNGFYLKFTYLQWEAILQRQGHWSLT